MAVVKRASVAEPTLPKETVEVAALDGEVVVRGLLLTERLGISERMVSLARARRDGDASADVNLVLPQMLALCVLDADGQPLWTEQQWQHFGAVHQGQALALFNTAWRLSGFVQAEEVKN